MSTGEERRVGERGGKTGDSGGDARWSSKELGDRAGEELVEGLSLVREGARRDGAHEVLDNEELKCHEMRGGLATRVSLWRGARWSPPRTRRSKRGEPMRSVLGKRTRDHVER